MALQQLNEDQQKLLDDFKSSGMTLIQFATSIGKSYSSIYHLLNKERRLKEQDEMLNFNHRFISVPIANKHFELEMCDVVSNDVIAFSINDIQFKMTKKNLKKFMEAIKWSI